MDPRCLDLDDDAASDPGTAGAKAAGLAAARAAGLPVLPGTIVPVRLSADVTAAAAAARSRGDVQARLAASRVQPDETLVAEVRARVASYPTPLIVRSSSPLEGVGVWSGAFSTFHGIQPDELGTAIRGCWGSAFAMDVLERADRTDTPIERLGLAVLVQPELQPDLGGTARLLPDGEVRISATDGPLRPLMAGNVEGHRAVVAADGTVVSDMADHALLAQVARLSRKVGDLLDHQLIEWAAVDGHVTLLQSIRSKRAPTNAVEGPGDPLLASSTARRVAALTQAYPGRLADDLVLPWAVAARDTRSWPSRDTVVPATARSRDPLEAFRTARELAGRLTSVLWGGSPRGAGAEAARVLRQLRGDDPGAALRAVEDLPDVDADAARRILTDLEVVRASLVAHGPLDSDAAFWRCSPDDIGRLLRGETVAAESRFGVDHWEPFVFGVVRARGRSYEGIPAAPGAGAGRAHLVADARSQASPLGRYVLVAPEPSPDLGALLWNAAGLVTRAGNTGAHLIEFAHSIGVPTVVGCDLPVLNGEHLPVLAVDGGAGTVDVAWLSDELAERE